MVRWILAWLVVFALAQARAIVVQPNEAERTVPVNLLQDEDLLFLPKNGCDAPSDEPVLLTHPILVVHPGRTIGSACANNATVRLAFSLLPRARRVDLLESVAYTTRSAEMNAWLAGAEATLSPLVILAPDITVSNIVISSPQGGPGISAFFPLATGLNVQGVEVVGIPPGVWAGPLLLPGSFPVSTLVSTVVSSSVSLTVTGFTMTWMSPPFPLPTPNPAPNWLIGYPSTFDFGVVLYGLNATQLLTDGSTGVCSYYAPYRGQGGIALTQGGTAQAFDFTPTVPALPEDPYQELKESLSAVQTKNGWEVIVTLLAISYVLNTAFTWVASAWANNPPFSQRESES